MKKELQQEILEIIKNSNYERYSLFQDPETKELVLQCFFTDYYDDTIGESVSFENYNEYTFEYDKELEGYLKTTKYYLYDIQNDERVFETDDETYWTLVGCVFNEEMLETAAALGWNNHCTTDEVDAIQYLSQKIMELKVPEERIYKIIKIEVD